MIHVMIVDDEERARIGITSLIDWKEHDIQVVAEARDGAEALEMLKEHRVDILLTDIRMPNIDGLRLIELVKERYPSTKSIIMSGYDDFNYAKKAMTLGASDYLLKPSRRQEILDTVLKLKEEIETEKKQFIHLERLKEGFRESLPLLREKALSKLVFSEDASFEKVIGKLELSGLTFPHPFFGLIRIQIDNYLDYQQRYGPFDIELLKYGLKNVAEETLSEMTFAVAFEDQDDVIVILNAEHPLDTNGALRPLAEKLKLNAEHYLHLSISIAIGPVEKQIRQLRTAYLFATNSLDAKFYMGPGKIVDYEEVEEDDAKESTYPIELEKVILQSILSGETQHLEDTLELFQRTLSDAKNSKDQIHQYTFALYFALYRLCIEKDLTSIGQHLGHIEQKISRSDINEIYKEFLDISLSIVTQLNERKQSNKLFESILEFIRNNYSKDISRETVAQEVYITPGYLSLLFKQQMKMSFLDFLHQVRIEHACTLLKDQSKRVADIAAQVGYNDEKYFFQVFKKHMGMTPKQFRNTAKG